jgi:hypothetical protein
LLGTLGKNINLDFSEVIEKRINTSLTKLVSEVKKATEQSLKASSAASEGFSSLGTEIENVTKTTRALNQQGNIIKTTVEGYDKLGNAVKEVIDAEGKLTRVVSEKGDYLKKQELLKKQAQLWKDIEKQQTATQKEESRLLKQLL